MGVERVLFLSSSIVNRATGELNTITLLTT